MNNNIKHLPNGDFQTLPDTGQPGGGGSGCASPQPAVTVIFDDGEGPTWGDALLHSPFLNIRDYGADNNPNSGALVSSSFHVGDNANG